MKIFRVKLLLILLSLSLVLSGDDLDIDNLLTDIEKKTDLSAKTKLENGGISYIYTRDDLQRMQAHNLKDVLKSTYPFGYNENRFGISDPFAIQTPAPFMSSKIKIYIDNQEISTGLYGSGLVIYGKMDIDFVDHIEVYAGNPTLESSTEPGFTIIKLYSKVAQKDDGSKITLGGGSYDSKEIGGYTTSTLDSGWSYFAYASAIDSRRKKYKNYGANLSRDSKNAHIFTTLSKDNHHFMIDAIDMNEDSFASVSTFATPQTSTLDNDYLHIGYDTKIDNFSFLATFDKMNTRTSFRELYRQKVEYVNSTIDDSLPYSFNTNAKSETYTLGLNYDIKTESNKLVIGTKYRFKHFANVDVDINNVKLRNSGHTQQSVATVFAENQYSIAQNQILTAGVSYSFLRNNSSIQDDNLLGYRVGYTYTNDNLISKTTLSHLEVSLDPYLVNSIYLHNPYKKMAKEKQDVYMQNIKYSDELNIYEMTISYMVIKNKLLPLTSRGLLDAYSKELNFVSGVLRYTREYNTYDKIEVSIGHNHIRHLPLVDNLLQYSATIRNFNTMGDFDIFNEVLCYRDDREKRNYYDYSAGIIYHTNDDLSFSIKGTNLFNRARASLYSRINPVTMTADTPLKISPIDRKVMLRVEYTF